MGSARYSSARPTLRWPSSGGFYQQNTQFDQTKIYVNQILGNHKSGKLEIDWGFGYNKVFSRQPDRKRFSIENYQLALDSDPTTFPAFYSNVPFDNQRYFQNIEDDEYNGRINLAIEASEKVKFNIGYNGRTKKRNSSQDPHKIIKL